MKIYRIHDTQQQIRLATSEDGDNFYALGGDPFFGEQRITNERVEVDRILAPVEPPTIYCIGTNYRKHAEEMGSPLPEHPVVFLKPPTTLLDPGQAIKLPRNLRSDSVDYEVELAVIIGTRCKNVRKEDALGYVLGYTIGNDVSARDWQKEKGGSQWCRGKGFDTFCPLGPALITPDEITNPNALTLETRLNGEVMQSSSTADMIFDVPTLIEFLSGSTTLDAGTVILTGTPSGVGMGRKPPVYLKPGDRLDLEIEKIGVLTNTVEEEPI